MENTVENTFNSTFENDLGAAPKRPQFLSVLCILTWTMCGLSLIMSLYGLVAKPSAEVQKQQIEQIREINPEAADKMEASINASSQGLGTALNLLAVVLSGFGAYMMWNLKKTGFYLYIAGELIPYIGMATGGAAALGALSSLGKGAEAAGAIVIGLLLIIDIVFIVLYGLNLKHMNK